MFLTSTRVPNGSRPARAEGHVRLHAQLAALHVGVGGADRAEQQLELLGVAAGLLGGPDLGLGDDLHQRRAGPVEVDEAHPAAGRIRPVDELGRVLLEVGPGDRDRERPVGRLERQPATRRERQVVLADLVALGQVRVEVVLPVPARRRRRSASIASPVARTCSTARRLITGSVPGRPRQTGQTWVFGGAPS